MRHLLLEIHTELNGLSVQTVQGSGSAYCERQYFLGDACSTISSYRPRYCFLCIYTLYSCYAIAIQVDFRQSFKGSISMTAQCIETQLMPNESLGRDLQIIARSLYVTLLHGVMCITEYQCLSNCFSLIPSFFLLATFWSTIALPGFQKINIKTYISTT